MLTTRPKNIFVLLYTQTAHTIVAMPRYGLDRSVTYMYHATIATESE